MNGFDLMWREGGGPYGWTS